MKRLARRLFDDERGSLADIPGWTILAVGTIFLLMLFAFGGRITSAAITVQAAAQSAARDASLSRSEPTAIENGTNAAHAALNGYGCTSLNVAISGNGLTTGLGEAGLVTATVSCTIPTGDLIIPGLPMPGEWEITRSSDSPVDPYRER